jgi:hypothetical protein
VSAVNDSNDNITPQTVVDKVNYIIELESLIVERNDKLSSPTVFLYLRKLNNGTPPCGFSKSNISRYYAIRTHVPKDVWALMAQSMSLTLHELYALVLPAAKLPRANDRRQRSWRSEKSRIHVLGNVYNVITKKTSQTTKVFVYR